jgi:hypothetical protein
MTDRTRPVEPTAETTPDTDLDTDPAAATDDARRAALAKLGALAAWTSPAMLTLLLSPRASAESGPPGPPG